MSEQVINEPAQASEFIVPADEIAKTEQAEKAAESGAAEKVAVADDATKVEDAPVTPEAKAAAREAYRARKAQRELEELRNEVTTLKTSAAKPKVEESAQEAPKRPNPDDFELGRWDAKYEDAMAKWMDDHGEWTLQRAEQRATETSRAAANEATEARSQATLLSKVDQIGEKGVDKYEDFEDIVRDAFTAMPPSPEALKELVQMENAEDVFYHIAQRPDALERITAMTPMGQALEFGKISARLAANATASARATKAKPTPTQPRGDSGQFASESDARYAKMLRGTKGW